jgi:putative toxin-antitoxin system antitoxin component (TIGR02293 family)
MRAYASTLKVIGVDVQEKASKYRTKGQPPRPAAQPGNLVELRPGMVPFDSVQTLAERLGADPAEVLSLIGMSPRTAARRKGQGFLTPDEADRLLRVARVVEEATRVFGSEDKAARWLKAPHPSLGDVAPFSLLDSDAGTKLAVDELTRIDYGDFA